MRLELVYPKALKSPLLKALRAAHPYEEIAFDLFAVHQSVPRKGIVRGLGYGFWGDFPKAIPFSEMLKRVKRLFKLDGYWIAGTKPKAIKRLGFVAGKGSSFLSDAISVGCDLLITGEAGHHNSLRGSGRGTAVMEIGHAQSEKFFAVVLSSWLKDCGLKVKIS